MRAINLQPTKFILVFEKIRRLDNPKYWASFSLKAYKNTYQWKANEMSRTKISNLGHINFLRD